MEPVIHDGSSSAPKPKSFSRIEASTLPSLNDSDLKLGPKIK